VRWHSIDARHTHILPQPEIQEFPGASRLMGSGNRLKLRGAGPIRSVPRDGAGHLATHGAGRSSQEAGEGTEEMALGQPETHALTYFGAQVSVRSRSHGNTIAPPGW